MSIDSPSSEQLKDLAAEAFLYAFPLAFNLAEVQRFTKEGLGALSPAPFNEFAHASTLASSGDTFVSINNDTVYSIAQLDVSNGPIRLDVPASGDRYYVLQFVDAWTNNFAYVGTRGTGNEAQSYYLVAPDFDGDLPDDIETIRLPTLIASIVGRWAVAGESDLPAVSELQRQLRLTPTADGPVGLEPPADGVAEDVDVLEALRVWGRALPPAERDQTYAKKFAPLGIFEADSPFIDPRPEIVEGVAAGRAALESAVKQGSATKQNGWSLAIHAFDYNLDFFEVGAIDSAQWKLHDDGSRYVIRAASARLGLWGNHAYEAVYSPIYVDHAGDALDGAGSYTLRFEQDPPSDAFWSVTMYDADKFYLVSNPINRYSIGDRTPSLVRGDDGSLTIHIQREEPTEPSARANWLPCPAGTFRPMLRVYMPKDALLAGDFELPAIVRG